MTLSKVAGSTAGVGTMGTPRGAFRSRGIRWATLALSGLLLAGCGSESRLIAPGAVATPSSSPAASPAAWPATVDPGPTVGDIVWTTTVDPVTNAPVDAVGSYSPEAVRIIASMPTRGIPRSVAIRASWEYNDTPLEAFTTELDLPQQRETTWISFHIDRDPQILWPEGIYAIAVSLDGSEIQRSAVEVVAAD